MLLAFMTLLATGLYLDSISYCIQLKGNQYVDD